MLQQTVLKWHSSMSPVKICQRAAGTYQKCHAESNVLLFKHESIFKVLAVMSQLCQSAEVIIELSSGVFLDLCQGQYSVRIFLTVLYHGITCLLMDFAV